MILEASSLATLAPNEKLILPYTSEYEVCFDDFDCISYISFDSMKFSSW